MKTAGEMIGTLLVILFEKKILNFDDLKRITGVDIAEFIRRFGKWLKK